MRSEYHHLYNRSAWRKLREAHLRAHPLCRMHQAIGQLVPARVVDHIEAHRGDLGRFYAIDNLQSLCKPCHDGHKQAQEHNADGILRGAGHDGAPIDLAHSWHRAPTGHPAPSAARGWGGQIPATPALQTGPDSSFSHPQNG